LTSAPQDDLFGSNRRDSFTQSFLRQSQHSDVSGDPTSAPINPDDSLVILPGSAGFIALALHIR
jgi:hypothetical protein